MLLGFTVFQVLPAQLLGFFNATEDMLKIGTVALRIISICFVFAGFSIIASVTCQALGKSIYSLFVSIGRQLVVLIPSAFLLSLAGNVDLVWWAFPISELVGLVLATSFLVRVLNKMFPKNDI
jgi:Na+-driven multidrug efflux pump